MDYAYLHLGLEDLQGEKWKDIEGFDGIYQVSSLGRIKSLERNIIHKSGRPILAKERILSQTMYRYRNTVVNDIIVALRIAFSREGRRYDFQVRRLVYQAFIGKLYPDMAVINVDGNGFNNNIENLKMVDRKEKQKRSIQRNRQIPSLIYLDRSTFKKTWGGYSRQKGIQQLNMDGQLINKFSSIAEAVRQTGCDEKSIITVAKGRWKHHRGFIWKYL